MVFHVLHDTAYPAVEDFEAAILMNASPWGFFSALETWDDSYYPAIDSMSTWKDRDKFYNV